MRHSIKIEWILSRFRFFDGVLAFKSIQPFIFNVTATLGILSEIGIIIILNKIDQRDVYEGKIAMVAG